MDAATAILQARKDGWPVEHVYIDLLGPEGGVPWNIGLDVQYGRAVGHIPIEVGADASRIDFSCVLDLPVTVFCRRAEDAAPFLHHIERAQPRWLTLAAADLAMNVYTRQEV